MSHPDFAKFFQAGQKLNSPFGILILTPYKIGELVLTSGKLVACDPLVFPGTDPFAANLTPGSYPVILSVAQDKKNDQLTVAYAMLLLSEQTPVRWEMATRLGEDLSQLPAGHVFCYGVDSGTGCFMDTDAAQIILNSITSADTDAETLTNKLLEALLENNSFGFMWADMRVDDATQANVIAFDSGLGDGLYPSYFGYDARNNIVSVVTKFLHGN